MQLTFFGPRDDIIPLILSQDNYTMKDHIDELIKKRGKKVLHLLQQCKTFVYVDSNEFDTTVNEINLFLKHFIYKCLQRLQNVKWQLKRKKSCLEITFGGNKQKLFYFYRTSAFEDILVNQKLSNLISKTNIFYISALR